MTPDHPEGQTHLLGAAQGFDPLPVRIETMNGYSQITSLWRPSKEELERLNKGECIELTILGGQPPMKMGVAKAGKLS